MSAKLVLRVEWNDAVRTRPVPFDTKKFSNLRPEILVEWKAALVPRGLLSFLTFPRPNFFLARLDFSLLPLTALGSPRMGAL